VLRPTASALIAGRDADAAALLVAADDELETLDHPRAARHPAEWPAPSQALPRHA
jgi:hypothetical protein